MSLIMKPAHRLLRVTAHLRTGVAMDRPYGLELSAILATQARRVRRSELGRPVLSDADSVDPEDFDLPLARCEATEDWYWAASCAIPDVPDDEAPESRTYFQNVHARHARDWATRPMPEVHARKGSYRDVMMPNAVTVAATLTWFAVGDLDAISRLLRSVRSLGRRRAQGEGRVMSWTVEPQAGDPWRTVHLGEHEQLIRPTPIDVADRLGVSYRVGAYAIRPPSWNPNRLSEMAMADA